MKITISGTVPQLCRMLGELDEALNEGHLAEVMVLPNGPGDPLRITLEVAGDSAPELRYVTG